MRKCFTLVFFLGIALLNSGCISHLFVDSETRLQIENQTPWTFVGLDIVSDDGKSVKHWIQDTLYTGEKSRVYEEDWVGTFKAQLAFLMLTTQIDSTNLSAKIDSVAIKTLAKNDSVFDEVNKPSTTIIGPLQSYKPVYISIENLELDGGSIYMILSNKSGKLHLEFR